MSYKLTSPSSLTLIDKINDDSRTVRHLVGMVADCAENACNAESEWRQGVLTYDSVCGVLNHTIEILESMDRDTQMLWGSLRDLEKSKRLSEPLSSLSAVNNDS